MFHQPLLGLHSEMMKTRSSAAASTSRVLQGKTTEVDEGSRTRTGLCEPLDLSSEIFKINSEIVAAESRRRVLHNTTGLLKGSSTGLCLGSLSTQLSNNTPVVSYNMDLDVSPDFLDFGSLLSPQSEMTQPKPPSGSQYCPGQRAQTQSIAPTVAGAACPQDRPTVIQDSTVCTEGSGAQDAVQLFSMEPEGEAEGGGDAVVEMDSPVTAVNYSVTNALPERGHLSPPWSRRDSSCLSRSHSMPSLSLITSAEIRTLRRAESSPDALLISSSEEFTPDITADENDDETFQFRCSCPGLYRCSVTGLVFHMGGEGDVVYRTVPWDWRLLVQHLKKPAGPLFDIKCEQRSVRGLHLPHCEIRSTGGCDFLSVAHVKDEGVEFISPNKATETHVVISVTGFSAFGNVKDEDSPPDPVRALVLLFYRPPADPDPESLLNVLLLPRNVVLRDVLRIRKKTVGDESYIETSPHCKLHPKQEYTLSASPEDHQVLVQPTEAEFDSDNYDNYFPSFQVTWEATLKHIKLFLRDTNGSHSAWERRVCLSAAGVRRSCGPSALNLPSCEKLRVTRSSFIKGISGPMLKSLLDKLFEKTVMNDSERESADEMRNKEDKARFVVDTVRSKGEAASSEMIEMLCEADPFLCGHLGLM
ncbi:NACHT, LRR and PYD domains-containing protein 1b allele 3-like [Anarrhichthys ocellatus]|uniref:NACHT, LRR and PYD domains-containing protein 1b allele 3-like n=1 Tax=Anarrhichthys ocellatus TaxID=433405 RepID=UPI0012ED5BB9|nr:NACHT, LRR and PYD domains-containing protein 1b allele 3-like [Anarrhichthys ocellatus]